MKIIFYLTVNTDKPKFFVAFFQQVHSPPPSPIHIAWWVGGQQYVSSPLDLFKVSTNYSTLSSRVKVGGPARKPEKGGGGRGVRANWQRGETYKLIPVIFDAFIRKAHHTARFPLTFALLRLTCCAHLSHWLNDSHDQWFVRNILSS